MISGSDNEQYVARTEEMDEAYVQAFENLPPQLREAMRRLGVGEPELENHESNQGSCDVSEFVELKAQELELSEETEFVFSLSELFDIPPATAKKILPWLLKIVEREVNRQKTDYLGRAVGILLAAPNVKVAVMGMAFAMDFRELELMGIGSMRLAAKRVFCTASYLSQWANKWCDVLELPRPKSMKSQAARETYSKERKDNHWRTQTC